MIFFSIFDLASLKIRDLHRFCWIVVVNCKWCGSRDSRDAVPPNGEGEADRARDGASLVASHHNPF